MNMARLPRILKILGGAAATICVSTSLVAGAEPPAAQATITSLAGSLAAVSAGSATDAWAVGQTRTTKTLALHWNGTSWAPVPTPAPGTFGSLLSGVTEISPANVWAVGASEGSGSAALVLHWNGMSWARVPTPSSGVSGLSGVSAVSANDIWAVGSGGTTTRETTLVLHWDGRKWTRVPSPTPPGQIVALFSVSAVSATDVWAVGRDLTAKLGKTLVLHWDGKAWTQVPSPTPMPGGSAGGSFLNGVDMVATGDVWSAGGTVFDSTGNERTLLLHWNGMAWTRF